VRLVPADDPTAAPLLVRARTVGVEYGVDDHGDTLLILHNAGHENFELATASVAAPDAWTTLIPGSDDFYMTGVSSFADFFVVEGREAGLDQIAVHFWDAPTTAQRIAFPEASYAAGLGENAEYATRSLRLSYESMVTPGSVFDYDVDTRGLTLRKVQEIPSGYDAGAYATQRLMLPARDGAAVPVSLVWRRDLRDEAAGNPLYLYGYGAYGLSIPPGFSTTRLSLVDRGFVWAIAHIRGGDDLGRACGQARSALEQL
jgi:oligopeptidase B